MPNVSPARQRWVSIEMKIERWKRGTLPDSALVSPLQGSKS